MSPAETAAFDDATLLAELKERFGHASFRKGQLEVLRALFAGRPTLAVMPTGAGKSLCYQLPSLLLRGVTVVVSPLLSLMKDQVDELRRREVAAAYINSSQSEGERAAAERDLAAGRFRLIYVAPERFRNGSFRRALAQAQVSLLAVDEAHCISEWGHSFRPDYEKLGESLAHLGAPRMLALTATATADVRADILRALRWRNPAVIVTGFDRPNLHLECHELAGEAEKSDSLRDAVQAHRPAIVYAATRRQAMAISRQLVMNGVRAAPYHAGLPAEQRQWAQESFTRGDLDAMAATNAFGLGVDKADVRLVLHATLPRSVEAYYQEAGRAGRDGQDAIAALLFTRADVFIRRRLLQQGLPTPALLQALCRKLSAAGEPLPLERLLHNAPAEASPSRVAAALAFLESVGAISRGCRTAEDGTLAARYQATGRPLSEGDLQLLKLRSFRDRQRLEHMITLARRKSCRRHALLRELGERPARAECEGCDVCVGSRLRLVRSRLPEIAPALAAWPMQRKPAVLRRAPVLPSGETCR